MWGDAHDKLLELNADGLGEREKAALCGCGLLENLADLVISALSSDTARPIIVERATTESGAESGPL
jgi:hypothetical protein